MATGGIALAVFVLATASSFVLSTTPGEAATSAPRVSGASTQTSQFPHSSAVVGIAATWDGDGYWIVTDSGYVAACGDAPYLGEQTTLNAPIVGIAPSPDGGGYYLVASDGGIFTFGDAQFQGSTGSIHLNEPVVGMAVDPVTGGYWLVATDGGIFAYKAPFLGSTGSMSLNKPVVGIAVTSDGSGYWLVPPMPCSLPMAFHFGDRPARSTSTTLSLVWPRIKRRAVTGSSQPTAGSLPTTPPSSDQPAAWP